jgi:hypothetical protein
MGADKAFDQCSSALIRVKNALPPFHHHLGAIKPSDADQGGRARIKLLISVHLL